MRANNLVILAKFIYLFIYLTSPTRVTTTAYANYCGPALPSPPCQLCLWEETGVGFFYIIIIIIIIKLYLHDLITGIAKRRLYIYELSVMSKL